MEGSIVAAGSGRCRCEDFGPPGAPVAPREWVEMSQCRAGGTHQRPLQSGSFYTDAQDGTPLGRSGCRKREGESETEEEVKKATAVKGTILHQRKQSQN